MTTKMISELTVEDLDTFAGLAREAKDYFNSMALIDNDQQPAVKGIVAAGLIEPMPFDGWLYAYFTEKGRELAKSRFAIEIPAPLSVEHLGDWPEEGEGE